MFCFCTCKLKFLRGSVLGHILFFVCIMHLSTITDTHSITHHSFADGLQLHMFSAPNKISNCFNICSPVQAISRLVQLTAYLSLMTIRKISSIFGCHFSEEFIAMTVPQFIPQLTHSRTSLNHCTNGNINRACHI